MTIDELAAIAEVDRLRKENDLLRAAVAEADRRLEQAYRKMHPLMENGYCPKCGGGCLLGFGASPAREALDRHDATPREALP